MVKRFEMIIKSGKDDPVRPEKFNLSRIALQTGYSACHLSRVFRGETIPSSPCLKKVAEALRMDMSALYDLLQGDKK